MHFRSKKHVSKELLEYPYKLKSIRKSIKKLPEEIQMMILKECFINDYMKVAYAIRYLKDENIFFEYYNNDITDKTRQKLNKIGIKLKPFRGVDKPFSDKYLKSICNYQKDMYSIIFSKYKFIHDYYKVIEYNPSEGICKAIEYSLFMYYLNKCKYQRDEFNIFFPKSNIIHDYYRIMKYKPCTGIYKVIENALFTYYRNKVRFQKNNYDVSIPFNIFKLNKSFIYILYIPSLNDRKLCHFYLRTMGYKNKMSSYINRAPFLQKKFYNCRNCKKYVVISKDDYIITYNDEGNENIKINSYCIHCNAEFNVKHYIRPLYSEKLNANCIVLGSAIEEEKNIIYDIKNMSTKFSIISSEIYIMRSPDRVLNKEELDKYINSNNSIRHNIYTHIK